MDTLDRLEVGDGVLHALSQGCHLDSFKEYTKHFFLTKQEM